MDRRSLRRFLILRMLAVSSGEGAAGAPPPASSTHAPPGEERRCLTAVTQVFYNTCVTVQKGVKVAVKAKRIKCPRCGERETVTRGERGPVSIYCDLCRDEVKREQAALRAQAYRQRRRLSG